MIIPSDTRQNCHLDRTRIKWKWRTKRMNRFVSVFWPIWTIYSSVMPTCEHFCCCVCFQLYFGFHSSLEFDIIGAGDSTYNKSPVVYIDHHLGLEKWCVPHLYEYAYKKVLQFKLNILRANGNGELEFSDDALSLVT